MDMGSINGQIDTGEISPEEEKDFRKKIKEHQSYLASLLRRKTQKIRDLNDLAMKTVEGNPRLHKYWDLKKAEAELEIVENLYKISKNLPDKKLEDDLYSQYRKAYDRLKQKEKGAESVAKEVAKNSDETSKGEDVDTSKIGKIIAMSLPDFRDEVKKYSPDGLKALKRALIDQKNLGLNELRSLRRVKGKELDSASSREKTEIMGRYNPRIYEIGEKIDKIREKINHIDG
jgi:DNA-directed RNA polymerase specialized sigma24 family protein